MNHVTLTTILSVKGNSQESVENIFDLECVTEQAHCANDAETCLLFI